MLISLMFHLLLEENLKKYKRQLREVRESEKKYVATNRDRSLPSSQKPPNYLPSDAHHMSVPPLLEPHPYPFTSVPPLPPHYHLPNVMLNPHPPSHYLPPHPPPQQAYPGYPPSFSYPSLPVLQQQIHPTLYSVPHGHSCNLERHPTLPQRSCAMGNVHATVSQDNPPTHNNTWCTLPESDYLADHSFSEPQGAKPNLSGAVHKPANTNTATGLSHNDVVTDHCDLSTVRPPPGNDLTVNDRVRQSTPTGHARVHGDRYETVHSVETVSTQTEDDRTRIRTAPIALQQHTEGRPPTLPLPTLTNSTLQNHAVTQDNVQARSMQNYSSVDNEVELLSEILNQSPVEYDYSGLEGLSISLIEEQASRSYAGEQEDEQLIKDVFYIS